MSEFCNHGGLGVEGVVDGMPVRVGRLSFVTSAPATGQGVDVSLSEAAEEAMAQGLSLIHI